MKKLPLFLIACLFYISGYAQLDIGGYSNAINLDNIIGGLKPPYKGYKFILKLNANGYCWDCIPMSPYHLYEKIFCTFTNDSTLHCTQVISGKAFLGIPIYKGADTTNTDVKVEKPLTYQGYSGLPSTKNIENDTTRDIERFGDTELNVKTHAWMNGRKVTQRIFDMKIKWGKDSSLHKTLIVNTEFDSTTFKVVSRIFERKDFYDANRKLIRREETSFEPNGIVMEWHYMMKVSYDR